ncbi:MAG: hypothetical protein KME04_05250 [Pleurocapsa minor GSE-CHR-MK-17-07R]|jgi:hypothetical protein|nr:hypothetical protein [Pleurocapsa minor GSE-CHR-MK 17-07R]
MFAIFRFLRTGGGGGKQLAIRAAGLAAIVIIIVIWGINYRQGVHPDTGIAGDTRPTLAPLDMMGSVTRGESISAVLAEGERHAWLLAGERGMEISVRVLGDWDSTLQIFPPNGDEAVSIDFNTGGNGQALICAYRLFADGEHRIVVSGWQGVPGMNFGDYALVVGDANAPERCA